MAAFFLFQQLCGVVFGVYFADGVDNYTLLVDDVCGAKGAFGHFPVHFLLAPRLVCFQNGEVGVGDEVERQLIFGDELLVGSGRVTAHPQHFIAHRQKALVVVTQIASLGGAAWRTVLGVEIKHKFFALKILQGNIVSVFVLALEIRGFCSDLQHNGDIFL